MRAADLRRVGLRARGIAAVLLACFGVVAVRAAHLSLVDERGAKRGTAQAGTVVRMAPARGLIVDRAGAELAVTIAAPSVYAIPREIEDRNESARQLAKALGLPTKRVRERLDQSSSFVYVSRWVSPESAQRVAELDLPGVGLMDEPRRVYPGGSLAGAYLGFSNIDGVGVRGIEQRDDEWLAGHAQRVAVERDARGEFLAHAGYDPRKAAGGDLALTLDAALQAEVAAALTEIVDATGARGGLVVVMDPRTGDLLGVAEEPRFDPNDFRTTPYLESRSRVFLDATEPGSTLKAFAVAAALEHRVVSRRELIDCESGHYRIPGKTLRDTHPHGLLDPGGILQVSSNIGAAKLAFRVGPSQHEAVLRSLGFGRGTGSGFPDESAGLLRPSEDWRPVDHATMAFGQGINVTAIQLASAVSALASDGVWRTPRLVAARRVPGGPWRDEPPSHGQRVLRPDVARAVLEMLEGVVHPDGTASRAGLRGVRVAGKTGTAQKLDIASGTYSTERYGAWFVGVAPADDPRLVIAAMIDEPRGRGHSGGATAAPLFARVAAAGLAREGLVTEPMLPLPVWARIDEKLPPAPAQKRPTPKPVVIAKPVQPKPAAKPAGAADVPAGSADRPAESQSAPAVAAAPPVAPTREPNNVQVIRLGQRLLVPDFRGLTPQQVRRITVDTPLTMELSGSGTAVAQEPEPGAVLGEAARVRIRFARREGEG